MIYLEEPRLPECCRFVAFTWDFGLFDLRVITTIELLELCWWVAVVCSCLLVCFVCGLVSVCFACVGV